jgi:PIN domain nuclease of toxin-antitoxin system
VTGLPVLADTHALHWWLADPSRLSETARERLDAAEEAEPGGVLVSVASRIDLHYLVASKRMSAELAGFIWQAVTAPERNVWPVQITTPVADRFGDPELTATLADPWDRLIVATAVELGVDLVTKDRSMHELGRRGYVPAVW